MDPFPDSIHYTNSAFNLLHGKGFILDRGYGKNTVDVPPLYPLTFVPFFAIFNDVRSFYFANAVLALLAYLLFYRIVKKIFPNLWVQFLVLFSYVSCLMLTWFTTLAMAENLLLPLFLLGLNLMLDQYTWKKAVLMAAVCVSFYATKYASIPLLVSFSLLYVIKAWQAGHQKGVRAKNASIFLLAIAFCVGIFELCEYAIKGSTVITEIIPLFIKVFVQPTTHAKVVADTPKNVLFSTIFIMGNLRGYFGWLLGGKMYVLWKQIQIASPLWAVPACIGLFLGLTRSMWRWLAMICLLSILTVIAFMMSFYTTDGRYLYTAISTLFLGLGFFLTKLMEFLESKFSHKVTTGLAILLVGLLCLPNLLPLKSAIMLNLRHAETPWPYISILRLNTFLKNQAALNAAGVTPIVISPLSPYYVDYFKTEKMTLLPLSSLQEQRAKPNTVWGNYDYTHLHQVYADFIAQKTPVYFASYGIGNDKDMQAARADLEKAFTLTEVDNGCANVCNIYELSISPNLTAVPTYAPSSPFYSKR